jgi:hypothetical protein
MITALILRRERFRIGCNYIILKFTHRLKLKPRRFLERRAGFAQSVLGARLERFAVLIEERTNKAERGKFRERIDKRRRIARNYIKIGT